MSESVPLREDRSLRNSSSGSGQYEVPQQPTANPTPAGWLLHRSQMPYWARATAILRGYRPIRASVSYCSGTVFSLHNESGNIWTHLLGTVLFIALYCHVLYYQLAVVGQMKVVDYLLLSMFFFGVVACLSISATFHTFSCYSEDAVKLFSKLDYCGITTLIACSFVPWIYYGFYNSPVLQGCYMGLSLFFAIACIVVSMFDRFGERHFQKYRAALFLGNGLSAILPAIHWLTTELYHRKSSFLEENHIPNILLVVMGATYVLGGVLYLLKVPEHCAPGWFDLAFHSHQLFHVLVVAGGLLYYHSIIQLISIRLNDPNHFYN